MERREFASTGQNNDGTNTIPLPDDIEGAPEDVTQEDLDEFYLNGAQVGTDIGVEFGMHESYAWYEQVALNTERNQGLYTADRNLGGDTARYTRQNNGGTRRGFEVPEERDYYPYWRPTPWRDIAILTSDPDRCSFYEENSQNVVSKFYCAMPQDSDIAAPIFEKVCQSVGGTWTEVPSWGMDAPECMAAPSSSDNHLGLTENPMDTTASWMWTLPDVDATRGKKCVLRVRYNISASNYPSYADFYGQQDAQMVDSSWNCNDETGPGGRGHCSNSLEVEDVVPLYDDPYVSVFEDLPAMRLAIDTTQVGRTFQDRSFVWKMKEGLASDDCKSVINLNVRGKRGNIVQAYPALEYDFVPNTLELKSTECVHVQIHSSDFNPANAAGEGKAQTDASNIVQIVNATANHPVHSMAVSAFDRDTARALYMVGQDSSKCEQYDEDNDNTQAIDNCGVLNARVHTFSMEPFKLQSTGEYSFISTRNNNFSNRSQKLRIVVLPGMALSVAAIIGISVGGLSLVGASMFAYARWRPSSRIGRLFSYRRNKLANNPGFMHNNASDTLPVVYQVEHKGYKAPHTAKVPPFDAKTSYDSNGFSVVTA